MYKAHRCSDDTSRMGLTLTDQVAEFHQCCWGIAKGKKCIGVLLNSKADACLGASDVKC